MGDEEERASRYERRRKERKKEWSLVVLAWFGLVSYLGI